MYAKENILLKQNTSVFKTRYVFCSLNNPQKDVHWISVQLDEWLELTKQKYNFQQVRLSLINSALQYTAPVTMHLSSCVKRMQICILEKKALYSGFNGNSTYRFFFFFPENKLSKMPIIEIDLRLLNRPQDMFSSSLRKMVSVITQRSIPPCQALTRHAAASACLSQQVVCV